MILILNVKDSRVLPSLQFSKSLFCTNFPQSEMNSLQRHFIIRYRGIKFICLKCVQVTDKC